VDVVLTQEIDKADLDKADLAHRAYGTLSETILHNVRIIAIEQEIVQGEPAHNAPANNATAGKPVHPVSLELEPEQVKKIAVAKHLGTLSLAIRVAESLHAPVRAGMEDARAGAQPRFSHVEQQDTGDTGTMFSRDVSPEIARQNSIARIALCQKIARQNAIARQTATVKIYRDGKVAEYSVKHEDTGNTNTMLSCDGAPEVVRQGATVEADAGDKIKEYSVSQGNSDER